MSMLSLLSVGLVMCLALQTSLWVVQLRTKEADGVDFGWCASIGLLSLLYGAFAEGPLLNRVLIVLMAGSWSLRLSSYLLLQRVLVPGEDERYRGLREHWGSNASRNFFFFFNAQAFLSLLLSLPFFIIATSAETVSSLAASLAVGIWIVSLAGESIADRQLSQFRGRPENKGKTCRVGLWKYSRHPNYFFEWLYWWSFVACGVGLPLGWVTLLGPLLMYWFLMKITGIPATEARALVTRGEDYREYQRTTSAFFPWFPKK